MHHQSHVDVLEAPLLQHAQLSVGGLLRRGAVDHHGERLVSGVLLQGLGCPDDSGALHVVAAGVAQPLQSVIFAQKADAGAALAVGELRPKGGFHPAGSQFHLETAVSQVIG